MKTKPSHFEFKDWEAAIAEYYQRRPHDPTLVFIISGATYVSGYWIMSTASRDFKEVRAGEIKSLYGTVYDVKRFEKRLRRKLSRTSSLSLGVVVT